MAQDKINSAKQLAFIRYYTSGKTAFNGTQSAIRAKYSKKSARAKASQLLADPRIRAEIDSRIMSEEEVLLRITDIARSSVTDLLDENLGLDKEKVKENGRILKKMKIFETVTTETDELKDGDGDEVKRTTTETRRTYDFELLDPLKSLELMGRHHKSFTDKIDHDVNLEGFSFEFARAEDRASEAVELEGAG